MRLKLRLWWKNNIDTLFTLSIALCLLGLVGALLYGTLSSYYFVEYLQYANVDFKLSDDFNNYEIEIEIKEKLYCLPIRQTQAQFVYAERNFNNFVVISHSKKIIGGEDNFSVNQFYINLNYEGASL